MGYNTIFSTLNFRKNSFDFLRFFLTILVMFSHTFPLGGFGEEPINSLTNYQESSGTIAVAGFFIISGFLITRSLVTSNSTYSFGLKRALRVLPGFWTCLLVTAFVFAPLVFIFEKHTLNGFLYSNNGPFHYVKTNFLLLMHEYNIDGLLSNVPHKSTFDGSLWTLFLEVKAYILLAIFGIIGLTKNKRLIILFTFLTLWFLILFNIPISHTPNKFLRLIWDGSFLFYATYFFAGSTLFLFSNKIPLTNFVFVFTSLLLIIAIPLGLTHYVMPITLPFIILWLAAKLPFYNFSLLGDFSYGIYIYSFPVQQLATLYGLNSEIIFYFLSCFSITTLLAIASWFLIEKPALSLKKQINKISWNNQYLDLKTVKNQLRQIIE